MINNIIVYKDQMLVHQKIYLNKLLIYLNKLLHILDEHEFKDGPTYLFEIEQMDEIFSVDRVPKLVRLGTFILLPWAGEWNMCLLLFLNNQF